MRTLEEIGVSYDKHIKGAGEEIIAAGQDLIEARRQAKHGEWEKWLEERGTTRRLAAKLMRVANAFRNGRISAHFSKDILIELSAENVEPVREQLVARIENGENLTARAIRAAARPVSLVEPPSHPRCSTIDCPTASAYISNMLRCDQTASILTHLLDLIGSSHEERSEEAVIQITEELDRLIERAREWRKKLKVAPTITLKVVK
jgi:hypothetical protein